MTRAITAEDFGAWLIKCDPKTCDFIAFVEDGGTHITDWSIVDNYRSRSMRSNQPILFWKSGDPTLTGRSPERILWRKSVGTATPVAYHGRMQLFWSPSMPSRLTSAGEVTLPNIGHAYRQDLAKATGEG